MKKINIWSLALFLAIAAQLSLAADNDIQCSTHDGMAGHCRIPHQCKSIKRIMDEKEKKGNYTAEQISFLGIRVIPICKRKKMLCCDYQVEEQGIRQLLDQDCGNFVIDKVFGGKEIKLMSRPWMALLNMINFNANDTGFFCVGTLIHKRFVLTAAHCFKNKSL